MKDIFPINKYLYTLRYNSQFSRRLLKTAYRGTELKPCTEIRNLRPNSLKEIDSSKVFNTAQKIKFCIKDFFSKCDRVCSFL